MVSPSDQSLHQAPSAREEQADPKKKKLHCKWGRWASLVAAPATSSGSDPVQSRADEDMDPTLWGELHRFVDMEEMIVANLPLHTFYQALSVCKKWKDLGWNRPFLEQFSKTSLRKPYFILHGDRGCHQAMLVQDATRQSWVLQQLPPFAFQQPLTSVSKGLVYTGTAENCIRGTVFNIHTKVFRRLPALHSGCSAFSSILAVDKGSYRVLVSWDQAGVTHVYDSLTGTWTRGSDSPAPGRLSGEDSAYCDGVVYIKRETCKLPVSYQAMFAYDFNLDTWTVLPRAPHGHARLKGLGEWNGELRDLTLDNKGVLRAWEFQLTGPEVVVTRNHERMVKQFRRRNSVDDWLEWQSNMPAMNWQEYEFRRVWVFQETGYEWVEVDCMPADVLNWFLVPYGLDGFLSPPTQGFCIKTSYCDQYVLLSHQGFPENAGLARFVLYDMVQRTWQTLHVTKDWICSCPFSQRRFREHVVP